MTSATDNEIRLRVDGTMPLSLQLNGDMEGRTLQLVPAEGGMTDLVIGGNLRSGETLIHSQPSDSKKERVVGFYEDPVEGVSRPVNTTESWACYHFEMHARKCAYCHNPYEVHRSREKLCDVGHRLAQEVAKFLYNKSNGNTYSTVEEDAKPVRVEIPAGYVEVGGLLKAIERSTRHRLQSPFVSKDESSYVAPCVPSRSIIVNQGTTGDTKLSRPRSGETPDWPQRSSLKKPRFENEEDHVLRHCSAQSGAVEVREPHSHNIPDEQIGDDELFTGDEVPVSTNATALHKLVARLSRNSRQWSTGSPEAVKDTDLRERTQKTSGLGEGRHDESLAKIPWTCDSDEDVFYDQEEIIEISTHFHSRSHVRGDDDEGDASSDEGSVFSTTSLASSATDVPKGTGFSPMQIAIAIQKLISVLKDDEIMRPLYTTAIHGQIGPRKFIKKFHRLLRTYSNNLKEEATDSLDVLAARLVAYRSRNVAEAISESYQNTLSPNLEDNEKLDSDSKGDGSPKMTITMTMIKRRTRQRKAYSLRRRSRS